MSNEIKVNVSVQVKNGNFEFPPGGGRIGGAVSLDQDTAGGGNPGLMEIGSTPEAVGFGDVVPGLVYLENVDDELYVDIEITGAIRVKPGDRQLFRLAPGATVAAAAEAGTHEPGLLVLGFNE